MRVWLSRVAGRILLAAVLTLLLPAAAGAQTEDAAQLKKRASELYQAAKYGEALAVAERLVRLTEPNKEAKGATADVTGAKPRAVMVVGACR